MPLQETDENLKGEMLMYNRHLDTFIQVADSGSFLKAADRLYISATAVTKQINLLESHLDVQLFYRSTKGLKLTEAGSLIYTEAKKMIRHSHSVLQKAKELESRKKFVIRVGVSLMNPANILLEHWNRLSRLYPNFQLDIVPFEDTVPAFLNILEGLGRKVDLVFCPYDTTYWTIPYRSFHLKNIPMEIICSRTDPLAGKSRLTPEDLHGRTLILPKEGLAKHTEALRSDLETNHPQIRLQGENYIDLARFNQIVSSGELILGPGCWNQVHPLVTAVPVDWEYTIPYGLIYAMEPPKELLEFLAVIGEADSGEKYN